MSPQSVKDQILRVIQDLPGDATVESAMERLYLLYKIEQGIGQADKGEVVSQEEAKRRMEQWLKQYRLNARWTTYRRSFCLRRAMPQNMPDWSTAACSWLLNDSRHFRDLAGSSQSGAVRMRES